MPSPSQHDRVVPGRRRPTVRIRNPRRITWAGGISLAIAGGAALLLILVRLLVRTEEKIRPFERTLQDVELVWRCELGHEFYAAGQVDPRACWTCGRPSFPITQYACPLHGSFDVSVKFEQNDAGTATPTMLRLFGSDWTPIEQGLECPRCRRPMTRMPTEQRPPPVPPQRPERRERP